MPDDGVQPARRPARAAGPALAQGRLQPPGPVRLLHGAGRRPAPGGVRDAGPPGAGPVDHHARRARPGRPRRRGARRSAPPGPASAASARPGIVVRLDGPRGQGRRPGRPRRGRAGPARPPVPLHRLAHDPRRLAAARRRRAASAVPARDRRDLDAAAPAGHDRGPVAAAGGARRGARATAASPTTPRRPTPWSPCPTAPAAGPWARRWPRPGRRRARCRAGGRPPSCATRSTCPPATGTSTLRTTWVEPAYLELDASWCAPGGEPASPLANGGAFGGKVASSVTAAARELADEHGRPVRVLLAREDAVRLGRQAPADRRRHAGRRHRRLRVAAHAAASPTAIAAVAPGLRGRAGRRARPADVRRRCGPPAGPRRGAARRRRRPRRRRGRPGVARRRGGRRPGDVAVRSPDGAVARAEVASGAEPRVDVDVACGDAARRGRAALVLRRRRPHGARLGVPARAWRSTRPARSTT